MNIPSYNNTSSIIPQRPKSLATFYKTGESPTQSKINLVIYVKILRGRPRDCRDTAHNILYVKMPVP